jgi:hypothetical protein
MATQPTDVYEWGTDGAAEVSPAPTLLQQQQGHKAGYATPSTWQNLWQRAVYRWIAWLRTLIGNITSGPASYHAAWWTPQRTPQGALSVCFSPELSLFVAVGSAGTRVMTSPDGVTWTAQTAAASNVWNSVCWAPALSLFVAVSQDGANQVMTSPDGVTWTSRSAASASTWWRVEWSETLGKFAAVALDGSTMYSSNGTAWSAGAGAPLSQWYDLVWSEELGYFLAVGDPPGATALSSAAKSTDGINWTACGNYGGVLRSVAWSPELGLFAAVSAGGTDVYTFDGTTWTAAAVGLAGSDALAIAWSPSLRCFLGSDLSAQLFSQDGVNWEERETPSIQYDPTGGGWWNGNWACIRWVERIGSFVAVMLDTPNPYGFVISGQQPKAAALATTKTNDSAAAGELGEWNGAVSRLSSATVALTNNTAANVGNGTTSVTLTPGDWEVRAMVGFTPTATTNITLEAAAIAAASATLPATSAIGVPNSSGELRVQCAINFVGPGTNPTVLTIPPYRVTVAAGTTKTLYLIAYASFTASTLAAFGSMEVRRVR